MAVNLAASEVRADPYPLYARLRQDEPVTLMDYPMMGPRTVPTWLVTRYEDVLAVLKDPRFSNDMRKSRMTGSDRMNRRWMPRIFQSFQNMMITTDDPEHRRLRDLVHKAFTPRMIEGMTGRIEQVASDLLDRASQKPAADLVADFALPLPLTVISEMMGVPPKDRLKFRRWSAKFLDISSSTPLQLLMQIPTAFQMGRFFKSLLALRRRDPQDDLITGLVQAENDNERLSEDEQIAMIFLLLLAGHETTVNLIGSGTLALLEHPGQLQKLREDPDLIESAVEELLRYTNPVEQIAPRYALEDVEIGGQHLPAGSMVMVGIASANRDETVFAHPDDLDITRQPNKHLAFGMGIHYCL